MLENYLSNENITPLKSTKLMLEKHAREIFAPDCYYYASVYYNLATTLVFRLSLLKELAIYKS